MISILAVFLCALFISGNIECVHADGFKLFKRSAHASADVDLACPLAPTYPTGVLPWVTPNENELVWVSSIFVGKKEPMYSYINVSSHTNCSRHQAYLVPATNFSLPSFNLQIVNVQPADEGFYTCYRYSEKSSCEMCKYHLQILDRVVQLDVREGEQIRLRCFDENEDRKNSRVNYIVWTHDYRRYNISNKEKPTLTLNKLGIHENDYVFSASRNDSGDITCFLQTPFQSPQSYKRKFVLNVHYKPKIYVNCSKVQIRPGEELTLECMVDAFPRPKITWLQYNTTNSADGHVEDGNFKEEQFGTEFYKTTFRSTVPISGYYVCVAENSEGRTEVEITVTIRKRRRKPT